MSLLVLQNRNAAARVDDIRRLHDLSRNTVEINRSGQPAETTDSRMPRRHCAARITTFLLRLIDTRHACNVPRSQLSHLALPPFASPLSALRSLDKMAPLVAKHCARKSTKRPTVRVLDEASWRTVVKREHPNSKDPLRSAAAILALYIPERDEVLLSPLTGHHLLAPGEARRMADTPKRDDVADDRQERTKSGK